MGVKTEINCGIDYSVQQKIEWIKDKTIALAFKLRQIEDGIKRKTSDLKKLNTTRDKIKNTIHKMNEAAKSLIFQLDKSESAEIIAKGTVYPDVYIEICHMSYIVPREMENVRFWLNKEKGKIDVETYKADLFLQPTS